MNGEGELFGRILLGLPPSPAKSFRHAHLLRTATVIQGQPVVSPLRDPVVFFPPAGNLTFVGPAAPPPIEVLRGTRHGHLPAAACGRRRLERRGWARAMGRGWRTAPGAVVAPAGVRPPPGPVVRRLRGPPAQPGRRAPAGTGRLRDGRGKLCLEASPKVTPAGVTHVPKVTPACMTHSVGVS